MPDLTLSHLSKSFGDNTVLHGLDLHVEDGEFFTLLGPSGCGKSTTLWSIAGLHTPDSGTILFGDHAVFDDHTNLPPERRSCGVVFQSYAIWPHMTVHANVAYPLKLRRVDRAARSSRVREVLELVELDHLADRFPHELSGGQQQRVALARALAHSPDFLLFDEPFSNLDAKLRERARDWLRTLQREIKVTTIFVTHDQDEALSMSDRIMVMDQGRMRQIGTPEQIYQEPADVFVADFVGTINTFTGTVVANTSTRVEVMLDGLDRPIVMPDTTTISGRVRLTIRPEQVVVHPPSDRAGVNLFRVSVRSRSYLGDHYRYVVTLGDSELVVRTVAPVMQSQMLVELPPAALRAFVAR